MLLSCEKKHPYCNVNKLLLVIFATYRRASKKETLDLNACTAKDQITKESKFCGEGTGEAIYMMPVKHQKL